MVTVSHVYMALEKSDNCPHEANNPITETHVKAVIVRSNAVSFPAASHTTVLRERRSNKLSVTLKEHMMCHTAIDY